MWQRRKVYQRTPRTLRHCVMSSNTSALVIPISIVGKWIWMNDFFLYFSYFSYLSYVLTFKTYLWMYIHIFVDPYVRSEFFSNKQKRTFFKGLHQHTKVWVELVYCGNVLLSNFWIWPLHQSNQGYINYRVCHALSNITVQKADRENGNV